MNSAAVFKGTFSDWRLVKTRGVVQVVFEIPVEESDLAYNVVGGMPNSAEERWFAIARLDLRNANDGRSSPSRGADTDLGNGPDKPAPRPRRPVAPEKRLAQQAGIACADPVFQRFLVETDHIASPSEEAATMAVRHFCEVSSRSELIPGTPEGEKWDALHSRYTAWKLT